MFEKSKFKITNLDEYTKMIELDDNRFTIGYNFHNEIQITCSKGLKIRSNTEDSVFIKLMTDGKPNDEVVN